MSIRAKSLIQALDVKAFTIGRRCEYAHHHSLTVNGDISQPHGLRPSKVRDHWPASQFATPSASLKVGDHRLISKVVRHRPALKGHDPIGQPQGARASASKVNVPARGTRPSAIKGPAPASIGQQSSRAGPRYALSTSEVYASARVTRPSEPVKFTRQPRSASNALSKP